MDLSPWQTPLSYIGLATLAYTTLKFTRSATTFLLPTSLNTYNRTKNNWALVTGASDGIGFGFSQELCARGFNVILHGRNRAKLETRAAELRAEFPTRRVEIVVRDVVGLTVDVDEIAVEVKCILEAQGGELSVLINNVGGEVRPYTVLSDYSFEEVERTISMNAGFMTQITRVLLPVLEAGSGAVITNVSSVSAFGMPYISVYASTKGFVDTFTKALEAECKAEKRNIEVLGLRVGQVKTAGFDVQAGLFVPDARTLASAGLNRVGCGRVIVWAYFWHWLQGLSFDILPRSMLMMISSKKLMALKKEEEEKAKNR
jgi:short-subunit dehydrogenase